MGSLVFILAIACLVAAYLYMRQAQISLDAAEQHRRQLSWGRLSDSANIVSALSCYREATNPAEIKQRLDTVAEALWGEPSVRRVNLEQFEAEEILPSLTKKNRRRGRFPKRLMDIIVSAGLLVFLMPLLFVVAIAIKLESKGPVFYRQRRVGLYGREFDVIKFRSMGTDAERAGAIWASKNDSRVTRVGKFIRKTRIDEIPQAINVLRGEMSFVGPRPERPEFVTLLEKEIPFYSDRHKVKPGITGWAQVEFEYGASVEDARVKHTYDLYYIKNFSIFLDLVILLKTVRVTLFGVGSR